MSITNGFIRSVTLPEKSGVKDIVKYSKISYIAKPNNGLIDITSHISVYLTDKHETVSHALKDERFSIDAKERAINTYTHGLLVSAFEGKGKPSPYVINAIQLLRAGYTFLYMHNEYQDYILCITQINNVDGSYSLYTTLKTIVTEYEPITLPLPSNDINDILPVVDETMRKLEMMGVKEYILKPLGDILINYRMASHVKDFL